MKTVRELNFIGEVKNHLNKFYNTFDKEVEDIIERRCAYISYTSTPNGSNPLHVLRMQKVL